MSSFHFVFSATALAFKFAHYALMDVCSIRLEVFKACFAERGYLTFQLSQTETDQVESAAIDAVLAMVVRLSENTFRPMFYKVRPPFN